MYEHKKDVEPLPNAAGDYHIPLTHRSSPTSNTDARTYFTHEVSLIALSFHVVVWRRLGCSNKNSVPIFIDTPQIYEVYLRLQIKVLHL